MLLSILWFVVATLLVFAGFFCLWPVVAHWLKDDDLLLISLVTFGLSAGLLSLWSLALAALQALSVWPVATLVLACWVAGYWLNREWFRLAWVRPALNRLWQDLTAFGLAGLALLTITGALAVVLINDLYYPFISDDALTLYALHARLVYEHGGLSKSVNGFPLLVPLNYAFTWLVYGSVNDHLAKLIPFAFGTGLVGSSIALARRLLPDSDRVASLLAGVILATTPLFVDNASTGYIDIPTGFYVTLATLYAIRWTDTGQRRDALLAGLLVGLAAWSKQSAVLVIASMAGVAMLRGLLVRSLREGLTGLGLLVLPALVIAGPWYARNLVIEGTGGVIVLPGEYHVIGIHPMLAGLLPPLQYPADFGSGLVPLYVAGMLAALWQTGRGLWLALRRGQAWPAADLVLAGIVLPYGLAWWLRFSFTSRFLLVIIGIYVVWAARAVWWLVARLKWRERRMAFIAAPLFGLLLFFGVNNRLGAVAHAVTDPLATNAEKLIHTKQDLYPTVLWLRENLDPGDRVLTMDGRLRYYLTDYRIVVGYPHSFEQISRFDYIVDASGTTDIYRKLGWTGSDYWQYRRDPLYFEEVFDGGSGSEVFRVLPAVTNPE